MELRIAGDLYVLKQDGDDIPQASALNDIALDKIAKARTQ